MWPHQKMNHFVNTGGSCDTGNFFGKRSLDRISVDRNCVLSVDQNCGNHLIKFFDTFHLIESFN